MRLILVLFVWANLSACGCTEIGCQNGALVRVSSSSGSEVLPFSGEAVIDGQKTVAFTCNQSGESSFHYEGVQCYGSDIYFMGLPQRIAITVTSSAGESKSATLTPTYKESQPNGPGCDPICKIASSELVL